MITIQGLHELKDDYTQDEKRFPVVANYVIREGTRVNPVHSTGRKWFEAEKAVPLRKDFETMGGYIYYNIESPTVLFIVLPEAVDWYQGFLVLAGHLKEAP